MASVNMSLPMLQSYFRKESLTLFVLGIASGLPILLVYGTLSVWLREAGVERSTIGFLSWAGLSYGFKFIWAPLLDQMKLPYLTNKLGRRRSWMLVAQITIAAALILMASFDPSTGHQAIVGLAIGAVLLGFASASQDIVIDAYRIEIADNEYQAMLSGIAVAGYRVGMLIAGAGALQFADMIGTNVDGYSYVGWQIAYYMMALIMGIAIMVTLYIDEPQCRDNEQASVVSQLQLLVHFILIVISFVLVFNTLPKILSLLPLLSNETPLAIFISGSIRFVLSIAVVIVIGIGLCKTVVFDAQLAERVYIVPFRDFFQRYGKLALWLLAIVCLYRSADIVMGVVAKVFYIDMGYEKSAIGQISFGIGLITTLIGGILGGVMAVRFGLYKMLLLGAILAPLSNLAFVYMAYQSDASLSVLTAAIIVDNLSGGLAGTIAVAFISSLVDRRFSASQYAALTAITVLLPKLIAGYSGSMVDAMGYAPFFLLSACIGIPVILLIIKIRVPYKQLIN